MSAIGETIKRLREERGWTQAELGARIGIDGTNIARRETGRTRIRANERFMFAKAFGMSVLDFDEQWRRWDIERTQGGPGIPIINCAPAGDVMDYEEYGIDSGQGFEYVDRGGIDDQHAFGVQVVGDSMQPKLHEGDRVILSPIDKYQPDERLQPGKIVFVRFTVEAGGGCMLARFFPMEGGQIRFQKDNAAYAPTLCDREQVESLSVAVERRERL